MESEQCESCGVAGPSLQPITRDGETVLLCAECNPHSPVGGPESGDEERTVHDTREVDADQDADEPSTDLLDAVEDSLVLQTRRRGRDNWTFTVADLKSETGYPAEEIEDALRELDAREDVPFTISHNVDNVDGWTVRSTPGGDL